MSVDSTRLATALAPEIESKMRSLILSGDATPYPQLSNFAQALAEAIAVKVLAELTTNMRVKGIAGATVSSLVNGGGSVVGYLNGLTVTGEVE